MVLDDIISSLEKAPRILKDLVSSIPGEILKERYIPGKWSIHEHACHIPNVQPMLTNRLKKFIEEDRPVFDAYIPGTTTPENELLEMDLGLKIDSFSVLRSEFVELLKSLDQSVLNREATHSQYSKFTPYIMARHIMLHDNTHMFRIEELWLTSATPDR